ncbi:MAG: CoA-binding protein [Pseudomonadota bacterium]
MPSHSHSHAELRDVLSRTRTIAAVGVSLNAVRPSFFVARYLAAKGFTVFPVNPRYAGQAAFGQTVYASMEDLPETHGAIQMVDVFRRSEDAGRVVDEALEVLLPRGLETIWMQIGVIDKSAAKRARKKGVQVLMNVCPKMEYQRLWGELSWGGINSGVITSKWRT